MFVFVFQVLSDYLNAVVYLFASEQMDLKPSKCPCTISRRISLLVRSMPRAPKRQTVAKRNITREGLESFVIINFKASCAISVQMVEMKNIRIP